MSDAAHLAGMMRAAFEASPLAPEGVELFRWWWVAGAYRDYPIPIEPERGGFVGSDGCQAPPYYTPNEIRIRREWKLWHGWVGLNRKHRQAVLFFADGGQLPPRQQPNTPLSDQGMHALADSGNEIRRRASQERWRRLADELGLGEGEEWKREDP